MPFDVSTLLITLIVVIYLVSSIKILPEYERGVIFRLGRLLPKPKGPGIILVPVVMSCSGSGHQRRGGDGASGSAIVCSRSRFGIRFWRCFAISLSLFSLVSALVLRIDFRCFVDVLGFRYYVPAKYRCC